MKYLQHIFLSAIIIPCFGYAQITLTVSDMVSADTTIYWVADFAPDTSITPGNPGLNNWDFSLMYSRIFDSLRFISPAATPYAGSFISSNLCVESNDGYEYYIKNTAGIYLKGVASDYFNNGVFLVIHAQPSLTLIALPANYLNSTNETALIDEVIEASTVDVDSYDSIFLTGTIQVQTVFDAYGTMITPIDTVNVLRQKIIETVDYTLVGKKYLLNAVLYSNQLASETEIVYKYLWWVDSPKVGFPIIDMEVDANGNVKRVEFAVPFNANVEVPVSTKCADSCDATATIANPKPYYTYLWSDPDSQATQSASGLCKGNYVVRVSDSLGAFANIPLTVANIAQLTGKITTSGVSCLECTDGEMNIAASGGAPPYTFQWDSVAGSSNNETVRGLGLGSYTVTILDANGCFISVSGDISLFEGLKVFPNPTYDNLTIITRVSGEVMFRVFDLSGRRVAEYLLLSTSSSIYVGGLREGIYIYDIVGSSDSTEKRGRFCVLDFE